MQDFEENIVNNINEVNISKFNEDQLASVKEHLKAEIDKYTMLINQIEEK